MSKFNSYAKMLDEAFREARDSYAAIAGKLEAAKKEEQRANSWFEETYVGERESRRARAKADLLEAQSNFRTESKRIWSEYDRRANQIRTEFLEAVRANGLASPDAVDTNTVELLKSGVLTPEDMEGLANRFDSNPTMLKLISRYANDAAEVARTKENDRDRMAFTAIGKATKDGYGKTVQEWDKLAKTAMYCSGRTHRGDKTGTDPDYVIGMGKHWEELTANTIADF